MKRLLLFLFLISPMVAQAETVEMSEAPLVEVEGSGMTVYITTHQIEEETDIGVLNCTLTTTYYNYSGKRTGGAAKSCNWAEYNCNYLGICSAGGGSSETDTLLQAILDKLSEPQETKEYPWDKGMSKRK